VDHSDGIVSQFTTILRKAAGVRVIPPVANGRSFSIKRTRLEATAVENMNRVAAIAAGLPIWIIAVVMMIRIERINTTTHRREAISTWLSPILFRLTSNA